MQRFITIQMNDLDGNNGNIVAFRPDERWEAVLAQGEWEDYIWQFAENHAQAVEQHDEKYMQFQADQEANRPTKDTY